MRFFERKLSGGDLTTTPWRLIIAVEARPTSAWVKIRGWILHFLYRDLEVLQKPKGSTRKVEVVQ